MNTNLRDRKITAVKATFAAAFPGVFIPEEGISTLADDQLDRLFDSCKTWVDGLPLEDPRKCKANEAPTV